MGEMTHVDGEGRAKMVDVSGKPVQKRTAAAAGSIRLTRSTLELIKRSEIKKGDVLAVARIAGIQAAKRTGELIPLCHPLALDAIDVDLTVVENGIEAKSRVVCTGRTGVEMEALTAVAVALLTIYDMCKAVDKTMEIGAIRLLEKVKTDAGEG